ncbi:YafY family transcriptional regulator [Ktedonosporobacter rubrisoli]|uniref:YafY family transcriptional regulator n=1 Tax=Ktedonosporobacter rubrisoli TaxID=2509675 RepID=A0A4P6K639_KTERU|nr:YafY family protein [Ktedonosporobacter rubrisoli]QBD83036.1 YafY family transcriptional regulator [Ktedonosporobacter rubrisoli]
MQKIERLVAITLLLQARGKMTAKRLADILGVSTRTIYRDIMALSLAHVPISMDYGPGGGYYLPDDYHFESAIFTREEAVSLVLSADMAGNYSLFAGDDGLHRALFKLEATLPEEYRVDVRAARERILIDTSAWYNHSIPTTAYLEIIRSAVLEARRLDILYPCLTDTWSMQWQCVEPYGLVLKGVSRPQMRTGIWYLVAFCHKYQTFQTFRVSYIENLHVLKEHFIPQADFDLQVYWQEARKYLDEQAQKLVLILRIAGAARHELKGSYTVLAEERDGSITVRIDMASLEGAVSYVLALGVDATVISPPQVRSAVATTAQAIAEMYDLTNLDKQRQPR